MDQAKDDKKDQERDDFVSGVVLALGSLPTIGVAGALVQARNGYVTNPQQLQGPGYLPPNLDPAYLFSLIQQAIDEEIRKFLQGLITIAQLEGRLAQLAFADVNTVSNMIRQAITALPGQIGLTIDQVDARINAILPNVLAGVGVAYQGDVSAIKGWINKLVSTWNSVSIKIPGFTIPGIPIIHPDSLFTWGGYTISLPQLSGI